MTFAHETWFEAGHRALDWSFAGETATLLLLAGALHRDARGAGASHAWDGIDVPFLGRLAPWMPFAVRMHLGRVADRAAVAGRLPVAGDGPRGEPAGGIAARASTMAVVAILMATGWHARDGGVAARSRSGRWG